MNGKQFFFLALPLLANICAHAREKTDTLVSTKNDRVIVTYDISQNNGQVTVRFIDAKKKLGRTSSDRYKKLSDVAVVFFDRTGNYEDLQFSGVNTDAFMVPSNVEYRRSSDGYFLLNDNPSLSFSLHSTETASLTIPIYLAHYESKRHYQVFSHCGNLTIKLSGKKISMNSASGVTEQTSQTITTQEEIESTFTDADEARILINKVSDLLPEQEEYPFNEELRQAVSSLRDRSYRITDQGLSARISEVLSACKLKEEELKEKANNVALAAEAQAKKAAEEAQARQDSIATAAQQKEEKDRKTNLWLIIGGAILAVFTFVANQAFQHFRNIKNQKSMMDMQETVVRRAENEAKRRAQSMARSQVNRVKDEARQKTRSLINEGLNQVGKGKGKNNKGISI